MRTSENQRKDDSQEGSGTPTEKRPKTVLYVGGAVVLIAIIAAGYFISTSSNPESTEATSTAELAATTSSSSSTSSTLEETSTAENAGANLDYALINEEGYLDCSLLPEIPALNEIISGEVDVTPRDSTTTECIVNISGIEPLRVLSFATSFCAFPVSEYSPYNQDMGWHDWYTKTGSFAEHGSPEADGPARTSIAYVPSESNDGIGCISMMGNEDQQLELNSLSQVIYDSSPQ